MKPLWIDYRIVRFICLNVRSLTYSKKWLDNVNVKLVVRCVRHIIKMVPDHRPRLLLLHRVRPLQRVDPLHRTRPLVDRTSDHDRMSDRGDCDGFEKVSLLLDREDAEVDRRASLTSLIGFDQNKKGKFKNNRKKPL